MDPGASDKIVSKVLVIGDVATGKTSVSRRYTDDEFNEDYLATIGVDFSLKKVGECNVQLWDIAGQERFTGLSRIFYKHAVAAIIVFDLMNPESFANAAKWKKDVDEKVFLPSGQKIPVLLLGNKNDMVTADSPSAVSDAEIKQLTKDGNFFNYYPCSAKTGENVHEACNKLVETVINNSRAESGKNAEPEFSGEPVEFKENKPAESGGCC